MPMDHGRDGSLSLSVTDIAIHVRGLWFAMAKIAHLYDKNRSGDSVMLLDP